LGKAPCSPGLSLPFCEARLLNGKTQSRSSIGITQQSTEGDKAQRGESFVHGPPHIPHLYSLLPKL
jgi:hypothetical protein